MKCNSIPSYSWFSRKRLERHIGSYAKYNENICKQKILLELQNARLLLPVKKVPILPVDAEGHLLNDINVQLLTNQNEEGHVLFCFTSKKALRKFHKESGAIITDIQSIVKNAKSMSPVIDRIIINPNGPYFSIAIDELAMQP